MIAFDAQSLVPPVVGGLLMGATAMMLLGVSGKVMGFSGITKGLCCGCPDLGWRSTFLAGMVGSAALVRAIYPGFQEPLTNSDLLLRYVLGGSLVGLGTGLANGCTSGHGLVGFSRFSYRSIAATCTFLGTAMAFGTLVNISDTYPITAIPDPVTLAPTQNLALICAASLVGAFVASYAKKGQSYSKTAMGLMGLVAGMGLHMAGMTKTSKVAAFLDLNGISAGSWDPRLLVVMASAHLVCLPVYHLILKKAYNNGEGKSLAGTPFGLCSPLSAIDSKLILGSFLFGIGWGITAVCPGPAHTILGASTNSVELLNIVGFEAAMALGWIVHQQLTASK